MCNLQSECSISLLTAITAAAGQSALPPLERQPAFWAVTLAAGVTFSESAVLHVSAAAGDCLDVSMGSVLLDSRGGSVA